MHDLHAGGQLRRPANEQRLECVACRTDVIEELFDYDDAGGGIEGAAIRNLDVVLAGDRRRGLGSCGAYGAGKQNEQC
jgi:hypothetical protein